MTHPRNGLRPPPLKGGEPAPSQRLRAREWLANAVRHASRTAPLADRQSRIRCGRLVATVPCGMSCH